MKKIMCFNPSQVSYEPTDVKTVPLPVTVFQSLIGKLRTTVIDRSALTTELFQSLIGKLRTRAMPASLTILPGFNPSQVSYEPRRFRSSEAAFSSFNPSQVSYERSNNSSGRMSRQLFQSLIGKLRTSDLGTRVDDLIVVSIPHR